MTEELVPSAGDCLRHRPETCKGGEVSGIVGGRIFTGPVIFLTFLTQPTVSKHRSMTEGTESGVKIAVANCCGSRIN